MKYLIVALAVILLYLQYRLWIGEGSMAELTALNREIAQQEKENARLHERNRVLAAEVNALKNDDRAIEERARTDLGLIKKGETFFMVVPTGSESSALSSP